MSDADELAFVPPPPGLSKVKTEAGGDYLIVHLDKDGRIAIQGSREEVEQFLVNCARAGLLVTLDHLSWCG